MTSSIILYPKILHPNVGLSTTPGPQSAHRHNPELGPMCEVLSTIVYVCGYCYFPILLCGLFEGKLHRG